MDCNHLHNHLDSGESSSVSVEAEEHLAHCVACRKIWTEMQAARAVLRNLPDPPVPPGLADYVLDRVRPITLRRQPRVVRGWALALAAALVLGIGIGIGLTLQWVTAPGHYQLHDGTVMVPADNVTVVRIALDSDQPLHKVGFVVNIPPGMHLQNHPGEQQVAWTGELAKGRNVLNLHLLASQGAAGTLETALHYAGHNNIFKVRVMAVEDTSMRGLIHRLLSYFGLA